MSITAHNTLNIVLSETHWKQWLLATSLAASTALEILVAGSLCYYLRMDHDAVLRR